MPDLLTMLGGALALAISVLISLFLGRRRGRSEERDRRAGQDARDYRDTRQEIDNADLGLGATDRERIDRLQQIARRRGSTGPD